MFILSVLMTLSSTVNSQQLLNLQKRTRVSHGEGGFKEVLETETWRSDQTALIIIDMWDKHWCPQTTKRVTELAPYMNEVIKIAREKGIFIIHAPSDVTDFYTDHPARRRAQKVIRPISLPNGIGGWCAVGPLTKYEDYPIDQSDGGCECDECPEYQAWSRQIASIEISNEDAISDSGEEIWSLLAEREIDNVLIAGVAANMCILGRPFGLRNLANNGKNVVFIRDLTDTMYDPESSPKVDHFLATDLVVGFIEKYVSPTITSSFLTGKAPFRYVEDKRNKEVD